MSQMAPYSIYSVQSTLVKSSALYREQGSIGLWSKVLHYMGVADVKWLAS
jgi:hypothetical protein